MTVIIDEDLTQETIREVIARMAEELIEAADEIEREIDSKSAPTP